MADVPYLGPPTPQFPGCRQLVVAEHRLIYEIDPDTGDPVTAGDILIITVFGPGQA